MFDRIVRGAALLIIIIIVACQDAPDVPTLAPTLAPASQLPTPNPTTVPATNTPAEPTATFTPSATPVVLTPQPTPLTGPGVNITSPAADSEIVLGQEFVASGLAQIGSDQEFSIVLVSATGHILDQAQPVVSDFSSWQATLVAPHSVSGRAEIQARLFGADGSIAANDSLPVMLRVDSQSVDRYLILNRPEQSDQAVAGYNVFFDGQAQNPVDSLVTISLWDSRCQNQVARQSFRLRGSGYWQGFVIMPQGINGQVCAVANFGEPGDEAWREAQVQIEVLPPDDGQAMAVMIGNPPPGRQLPPGRALLLYGTAYNAPDREVLVSIVLENGRLLTEGVAVTDAFGYWELELFIPETALGPAQIEATVGERGSDQYAQSVISVQIGEQ